MLDALKCLFKCIPEEAAAADDDAERAEDPTTLGTMAVRMMPSG